MIIELNGEQYAVPAYIEQRFIDQIYLFFVQKLEQLDKPIRLGLKPVSRHFLGKLESELNKLGKDGKQIRPKDGADPTLHYARILLGTYQEALKDAVLSISTEGQ